MSVQSNDRPGKNEDISLHTNEHVEYGINIWSSDNLLLVKEGVSDSYNPQKIDSQSQGCDFQGKCLEDSKPKLLETPLRVGPAHQECNFSFLQHAFT